MRARATWPGRPALIARSGLWDLRVSHNLGREGGPVKGLIDYVRAGPDSTAFPKALFDQTWYLEKNPDLMGSRWAPLAHYLVVGDRELRDPHPLFDLKDYRGRHAVKVAATGLTALQHFVHRGAMEGFDPHPLFDLRYYVGQAEDVADSGENPLIHYLREGWRRGYDPHPLFAGDWYLAQNPDVADRGLAPLLHYVTSGAVEGRSPHPLFEAVWYAEHYRDAAPLGSNALSHFLDYGAEQRRNPSALFDVAFYLEQNPAAPSDQHPVIHYLMEGAFEGVSPAADFNEATYLIEHPEAAETPVAGLLHWALSRTPKPEPGALGRRALGDDGLFEQLRSSGRMRDAGAYDIQAYRDMTLDRRRQKERAIAKVKAKKPKLISVAERGVEKTAAELAFEAVARPKVSIVIPAYNNLTFTLECLAALQAAGGLERSEGIVIDDASDRKSTRLNSSHTQIS